MNHEHAEWAFQACLQHAGDFLHIDSALETPGYCQTVPTGPAFVTPIRLKVSTKPTARARF